MENKVFPYFVSMANESIRNQGVFDVVSPNMFAGSILDLEPNTVYTARFVMFRSGWLSGGGGQDFDEGYDRADPP